MNEAKYYFQALWIYKVVVYIIMQSSIVIIGKGSYGIIFYDINNTEIVSKLHYLSSLEQETGCDELFQHEYKYHNLLYQTLLFYHDSNFIIPKPINYKRLTQQIDACVYNMEKLKYPSIHNLENIIKPDKLGFYVKTNPVAHSPPYLLFSAISDDYENGRVKLTDMQGFEKWNGLFYVATKPAIFAKSMINNYFLLSIESQVILQDVEFLLTEKDNQLCVGMIDFNQVIDFETRSALAKKRIPNYSLEYDIANTYLFLSGIDTGSPLTDRNTQWKFLPTPHILPHIFFSTMSQIQFSSIDKIMEIICSKIFAMEMDAINIDNNLWQDILVWHEILIYGAYDTELFDKLNQHMSYKTYNNEFIHNYSYFAPHRVIGELDAGFDDYYVLTSLNDQTYLERMRQKQNIGLISQNLIDPFTFYDIMFQRLFIAKSLQNVGLSNINVKKLKKMLKANADFETLIMFINKHAKPNKYKRKTQKLVKIPNRKTRKNIPTVMQSQKSRHYNKNKQKLNKTL